MSGFHKTLLALGVMVLLPAIFMWQTVVKGFVAFPGDLLVGAYYPWFEHIPVKNPLISDAFSQIYSWKYLIRESYLTGHIPLWNQHSLSGYPLLANFHSGALYPLNILFLGNFVSGINFMLYAQIALGEIGMYFFLRLLKYPHFSALVGAVGFAFCGFSLTLWQVAYPGHTLAWLAFALVTIERKKEWYWPIFFFLAVTAGHYQGAIYFLAVSTFYYLFKNWSIKAVLKWFGIVVAGVLLASVQLLPTLEMAKYSVRFEEGGIEKANFGLVPMAQLATLIAPDFFGNPTTYNYWGSANYQETIFYVGMVGASAILLAMWQIKFLNKSERFFLLLGLTTLALGLATPLGKLIYWLKVPALSTSYASRVLMLLPLASGVLTARLVNVFGNLSWKGLLKVLFSALVVLALGLLSPWQEHSIQILRNLLFPGALLIGIGAIWLVRNKNWSRWLLLVILIGDLFRFGWKYNPFVSRKLFFPETAEINYLQKQPGFFRVDRENGPVLPPNTWEVYGLNSASGYDPVGLKTYAQQYHQNLNGIPGSTATRYTELSHYPAEALGKYGVKYLLVRNAAIPNLPLIGWQATLNGQKTKIFRTDANFQSITLPKGQSRVKLRFLPSSFYLGLVLSSLGCLFSVFGLRRVKKIVWQFPGYKPRRFG